MGRIRDNQKGFTLIEGLLVVVALVLVVGAGVYVMNHHKSANSDTATNTPSSKSKPTAEASVQAKPGAYTLGNEGLSFSYDPETTTVTTQNPSQQNGLYIEKVKVVTGLVTLSITAGISGIGGSPSCIPDGRATCDVVGTLKSTFLGNPITYRLVKTNQVGNCGYAGVPSCDQAPLATSFLVDTSDSTEAYGPCCGTVQADARNTGKKAQYAGDLLVTLQPDEQINNEKLLTNKDFLNTIKIIESMHY